MVRIQTYRKFWPFYLQQHARPICRALHYVGTTIAIASLISLLATGNYWFLFWMLVGSYGFAWIGHFVFERNRPATFTYPWWSLISDFRMYFLWLAGNLGPELEKAGVPYGKAPKAEPAAAKPAAEEKAEKAKLASIS